MSARVSLDVSPRTGRVPWALAAAGAVVSIHGLASDPGRAWPNLLLDGFYAMSLAVSAIFFISSGMPPLIHA